MPGIMIEPDDLCLYVTEACNSNCIMCPMSLDARKRGSTMCPEEWDALGTLDPNVIRHITITGGEPFLVYDRLAGAMNTINERFPAAEVLLLTNGRALSIPGIFDRFAPLLTDRYTVAIPVHGPDAEMHDMISQSPGSFTQTMRSIRLLGKTSAKIEIRIVGSALNLNRLRDTFGMLTDPTLKLKVINLIAMEMTGCAAANREALWIPYEQVCVAAEPGIRDAIHHGIHVGLYNFPLCTIPAYLWPLARRSITPSKVRYSPECDACREKEVCGGMFYSVYELKYVQVKPFSGET